jgi:uncharacterized protein
MALICDTGPVYALYDADDAYHQAVRHVVETERGQLFLPAILLAEVDYLLQRRLGNAAALDFVESIEQGAFTLIAPTVQDLARCRELMSQYHDLAIGLADASVVATAERLGIQRILTVDERHFRAVQPRHLPYFILLPADVYGST